MSPLQTQTGISRGGIFARGPGRIVFVLLLALLLVLAFALDARVLSWVQAHQSRAMLNFMGAVSRWGDWAPHFVAGLVCVGIAAALRNRTWLTIFAAMTLALCLGSTANRAIKIAAGRSRPNVTQNAGWNGPRWSAKYESFPSGHTASSTAFFATLFFARRRIGIWFLPIPALIASSRIYVSAHFLSDVAFAAMLGTLCAFATWRLVSRRAQVVA